MRNFLMKTAGIAITLVAGVLSAAAQYASAVEAKGAYKIRPLDVLSIRVFQEPELDIQSIKVGANGEVVLPLIGAIELSGLTVQDAQTKIKRAYEKDYLVNADVTLFILDYSKQRVYVIGQVNMPGEVEFPPEESMTLSKAISRARGTTRIADLKSVKVKRKMADGSMRVFDVDLKAIFSGDNARDFPVYDGDTIEVSESIF